MKSYKQWLMAGLFLCSFVFSEPPEANAQEGEYLQPRMILGGDAALFRISLDQFESVYDNRLGMSYGGFAAMRVYSGHYLLVKYRNFHQDGREGVHPESGQELSKARWDEKWYAVGVRMHPPLVRRTQTYYGFGVVFYNVKEKPELSVFNSSTVTKDKDWGNGFFLEMGAEYFLTSRLGSFFEMEVSSGGVRGKTGFEAFSVGGFRFALGLNWWPF
jgi:hypothetical protein